MQTRRKIAVAGATGRLGRHLVDLLGGGHEVVAISRSKGVDVITGDGLAEALAGVDCVIDAATGPSPEYETAKEFFTTASRNLHSVGAEAGVQQILVVSIIGADRFTAGYGAAKLAHEKAALSGPIPATVVRAAQFHEFVEQLVYWGRQGDVSYVPRMRTQLVAARTVAQVLAEMATAAGSESTSGPAGGAIPEIAGPREESLIDAARLLATQSANGLRVEEVSDPTEPDHDVFANGGLLPAPGARIAGPTFEQWLHASNGTGEV